MQIRYDNATGKYGVASEKHDLSPEKYADLVKNVKINSAGGGFRLKSLPTGTYLFKVSFAGYKDVEVTDYVNEGQITRLELPMNKIE